MRKRFWRGLGLVVLVMSGVTLCRPPTPTVAKVEVPPYATVTADETTVKEIIAPLIERSRPSRRETWMAS
ncbi:MAG TPA: hypothetical protein VEI50_04845 [Nitrospiraceae bacterium]|nr:hypothetical protein [Nitrospiraceae bacterium]